MPEQNNREPPQAAVYQPKDKRTLPGITSQFVQASQMADVFAILDTRSAIVCIPSVEPRNPLKPALDLTEVTVLLATTNFSLR